MKDKRHWLPFLLINIFVSAVVTGAILFWYDRTYQQTVIPAVSMAESTPVEVLSTSVPSSPPVTLSAETEISVEIVSVIGAGTLDAEMVLVRYMGEDNLDLAGWQLKDEDKNIFVFPQLTLYPEGAVQVHTMAGQNTVVDLYWGMRQSLWQSGEIVSLIDSQGTERATYKVP